jgi:DNA repair protein RadC
MPTKDSITAEEVVAPALKAPKVKKPKEGVLLSQYSARLVKGRTRRYATMAINSSGDLAQVARMELGHLPHEEVIIIGLSGRNEPLGVVKVSQGGLGGAAVAPADVIRPLAIMNARAFVIAHNHPSGDPRPSSDDVEMTKHLQKMSSCAGIQLLDHLIIGGRGGHWTSMRDLGIIT